MIYQNRKTMTTTKTLSADAIKLAEFLKKGSTWMQNCISAFVEKPTYSRDPEAQAAYWQYEANMYGVEQRERPVGETRITFQPTENYMDRVSKAYQELRKAGLAGESNNGFNEYMIFLKK